MRELAFLWHEDGAWMAAAAYGPTGRGESRGAALASLRSALNEHQREIDLDACLPISPAALEAQLASLGLPERSRRGSLGEPVRPLRSVREHPWGTFFRRNRILSLGSGLYELELPSHWLPTSTGLFSFDGSNLLALNRRPENLESLLRSEGRPLDEADPEEIARFFAEAIGRRGRLDHALVSLDSLERMDASGEFDLDRQELARIAPAVRTATISTHGTGWTLEFSTLFGWSEERQELLTWQIDVSRRFALRIRTEQVSERVFDSTPIVME